MATMTWAVLITLLVALSGAAAGEIPLKEVCGVHPEAKCQYTVQANALLTQIAQEYEMDADDIVELNPQLANLTAIPATQNVTLPCLGTIATSGANVVDLLCRRNEQQLFLELIVGMGLAPLFQDPELSATVFAPKNSAMRAALKSLGFSSLQQLLNEEEDTAIQLLSYHIVPDDAIMAGNLTNGEDLQTMLDGQYLTVYQTKPGRSTLKLLTSSNQTDVKIIKKDFTAGAAVVHVVNRVLMPLVELPDN